MAAKRPWGLWLGTGLAFLAGAVGLSFWVHGSDPAPGPIAREASSGDAARAEPADEAIRPVAPPSEAPDAKHPLADLFAPDDPAWAWSRVDLDALRQEMPDNAFWTLAAPTLDPVLLEERRLQREARNREYGKVLSNTATEQEVRDYYALQQSESSDLVTFTTRLLDTYGEVLPDRDRGLVELAQRMHRKRLEEIPRHLTDALERREAHAAAVEAWQRDQTLFAEDADSRTTSQGEAPAGGQAEEAN